MKDKEYCIYFNIKITGHKKRECSFCKIIYARKWRKTEIAKNYNLKRFKEKIQHTKMEKAKSKIYVEVRSGRMLSAKSYMCVDCNKQAQVYDHRDYNKPLEVEPVCRKCNLKRGPALNKA